MTHIEPKKTIDKVSNLSYLSETMGGNKKLIKEIIEVFLKQAPEELAIVNKAVQNADYLTLKNYTHTMKSSVSIMGISALAEILKEMEELAKSNTNIERITLLNNELNSICTRAIAEIEKERSTTFK